MCYGFDGDQALEHSLATKGLNRRSLLRTAATGAAVAGAAATGLVSPASAAQARHPHNGRKVPKELISIQLWTVRDALNGTPGFDETLLRIAEMGYGRVEQALGYFGRSAGQLKNFYDDIGIRATSSHDGISATPEEMWTKLENAKALGQRYINVPFLNSEKLDDWKRWAEQMNTEGEAARKLGLRYGYHNHAHEFTIDLGGGTTPWDVLTRELDPRYVHFEADLYWVVTGGINSGEGARDPERFAIDVIRSAPQKVLQYHVKDRSEVDGDMADLGTGIIDFPRIFRAHQVKEYIVENDTPDVTPLHSARVGYRYLRNVRF